MNLTKRIIEKLPLITERPTEITDPVITDPRSIRFAILRNSDGKIRTVICNGVVFAWKEKK